MVARELILGARRLPGRGWRRKRQYEVRFRDGGAASCSLRRLDELLEARRYPADYWVLVHAADDAFKVGDSRLHAWVWGVDTPGLSEAPPLSETLHREGAWIVSSLGYRVRSTGRFGIEYADERGTLKIEAEWLDTPRDVIYTRSLPDDRPEVLERVMRAWLWAGLDVDLEPPVAWS